MIPGGASRDGLIRLACPEPIITGYYGKVPGCGDFVSRGLPYHFVAPWDRWLQKLLSSAATRRGQNWKDWFDHLPPLAFALSPGVCGPAPWTGVWVPSRDQVGRRFPLALCRRMGNRRLDAAIFTQEADWFRDVSTQAKAWAKGDCEPDTICSQDDETPKWFRLPSIRKPFSWWCHPAEFPAIVKARGLPDARMLPGWIEHGG